MIRPLKHLLFVVTLTLFVGNAPAARAAGAQHLTAAAAYAGTAKNYLSLAINASNADYWHGDSGQIPAINYSIAYLNAAIVAARASNVSAAMRNLNLAEYYAYYVYGHCGRPGMVSGTYNAWYYMVYVIEPQLRAYFAN